MAANGSEPPVFDAQLREVAARLGAGVFAYGPPPDMLPLVNTGLPPGVPLLPAPPGSGPAEAVPRVFASGRPQIGRAWFGPLSRRWVAAAYAPVFQGDQVAAALAVGLDLPELGRLLEPQALRPEAVAMVVDHAGIIVAGSGNAAGQIGQTLPGWFLPALPAGPNGVVIGPGPNGQRDGQRRMYGFARLAQAPGWLVTVSEPMARYDAAWQQSVPPLAIAGILALAAGAWLALLLARRCLRPVAALTDRAAAIAAGRPADPGSPPSQVREFAMLSNSLTAAHAALEQQAAAAREGHELLQSVIDGTPDAVDVKTLDGRTIVVNAAACALFGLPTGALLGQRSQAMLPPETAVAAMEQDAEALRVQGAVVREHQVPGLGGRTFRVTKLPWRNPASGRIAGIITLVQDVTTQRRTEAELRQAEAEMERLGRRATAGAMASGLAHELNQPLTAATNYLQAAECLLDGASLGLAADRAPVLREAVRAAAQQTLRAGEIIRRLRDFVTRRVSQPSPEPIAAVVDEGVRLALGGARPAGLQLRVELAAGLERVTVDRVAVLQVLVNLVRNAVEAMHGSPRQELTVSAGRRWDGASAWLDICVADSGPGLPGAVMERLFEPFVSTKPDGMGVGLAICRRIAEAQGGEINADPGLHGGTVFTLTLPLADGAVLERIETGRERPGAANLLYEQHATADWRSALDAIRCRQPGRVPSMTQPDYPR